MSIDRCSLPARLVIARNSRQRPAASMTRAAGLLGDAAAEDFAVLDHEVVELPVA